MTKPFHHLYNLKCKKKKKPIFNAFCEANENFRLGKSEKGKLQANYIHE